MKNLPYLVVFDGTSHYTINKDELVQEMETNEVEVINEFSDFNTAFDFAEGLNDECTDHIF